jgi:hypothetical protein
MTKFELSKNGTIITHIPAFTTRSSAEEYVIAIGGGYEIVETPEATPANNETATATALLAENAVLKSEVERLSKAFANVREYIQASIDRGEWDGELDEIFWEELALTLGLDLKLTEEIEVRFLVTYEATLTVPKGTDIDDLELMDLNSYPDVHLNGDSLGEARWEETEVNAL